MPPRRGRAEYADLLGNRRAREEQKKDKERGKVISWIFFNRYFFIFFHLEFSLKELIPCSTAQAHRYVYRADIRFGGISLISVLLIGALISFPALWSRMLGNSPAAAKGSSPRSRHEQLQLAEEREAHIHAIQISSSAPPILPSCTVWESGGGGRKFLLLAQK